MPSKPPEPRPPPRVSDFGAKVAPPAPKKQKSVPQRDGKAKLAARYAKSMV